MTHCCWDKITLPVPRISGTLFVIHPEKSVLVPSQQMEFLGFLLNSVNMTIRLPPTKAERVQLACQSLLHKSKMSIREVAQVIGLIVSSFPAVQFGE